MDKLIKNFIKILIISITGIFAFYYLMGGVTSDKLTDLNSSQDLEYRLVRTGSSGPMQHLQWWRRVAHWFRNEYSHVRNFFKELHYRLSLLQRTDPSLTEAISNIEKGQPAGVGEWSELVVVLRAVDEEGYEQAQVGVGIFDQLYGKDKFIPIKNLVYRFEPEFQRIRATFDEEVSAHLEEQTAEAIWARLMPQEQALFEEKAQEFGVDGKRLVFNTIYATANERNYIREIEINKARELTQEHQMFIEEIAGEIEGLEPRDVVIRVFVERGLLQNIQSMTPQQIDEQVKMYFTAGTPKQYEAEPKQVNLIFVKGTEAGLGSFRIGDMYQKIVEAIQRVTDMLEKYGMQVDGPAERMFEEIDRIVQEKNLPPDKAQEIIAEFNREVANIDMWTEKLGETGGEDVKDELVEISKMMAGDAGVTAENLQKFITMFLDAPVKLPGATREKARILAVQDFVRCVLEYRLVSGELFKDILWNLGAPEVARRATKLILGVLEEGD